MDLIGKCVVKGTYAYVTPRLWEWPVQPSEIGYVLEREVPRNECKVYSDTGGGS